MSSNQLKLITKGRDTNHKLMETQWQKEFYRVATSLLPPEVYISPEYGQEVGIDGQVDFYIAEYKWMIEILRDGKGLQEHVDRFMPGGQYDDMLGIIEKWVVIDFRSDKQAIRYNRDVLFVSVDAEYKQFELKHPGEESVIFS